MVRPAPGPGGLLLAPAPGLIAELGYYDLHVIGVEKKRADALKRVCAHAARLEAAGTLPAPELRARLEAIPGIGPWTSAEVARVVVGARISKSGNAASQPGDLEGASAVVANDAVGVKVVIDGVAKRRNVCTGCLRTMVKTS